MRRPSAVRAALWALFALALVGVSTAVTVSPSPRTPGPSGVLTAAAHLTADTDNDVDDDFETASLHPLDILPGAPTGPQASPHRLPVPEDIVPAIAVPRRCESERGPPRLI